MKTHQVAVLLSLSVGSVAFGQQAVEWKMADGGNGHWYAAVGVADGIDWETARTAAVIQGAQLVSLETSDEAAFCFARFSRTASPWAWTEQWGQVIFGPWIGGYQIPGSDEPLSGWMWVSGAAIDSVQGPACCNNDCGGSGNEDRLHLYHLSATDQTAWNDIPSIVTCGSQMRGYVIEWSADCNNDGIVDKGQIVAGQLADSDNNGIPDSCQVPSCRDADFFRDFNVNGADLGILLSQWGPSTPLTVSDLSGDGVVDGNDLGIFLGYWGPCPN
jgi:hypothetical protein